jgi:hypothetical protein
LRESQQTSCIRCHFNGLSCEYLPTKRQQERSACPKNTRRTRTRRKASRQTSPVEQPGSSAPGVWSTSLDQAASVPIPPTTPHPDATQFTHTYVAPPAYYCGTDCYPIQETASTASLWFNTQPVYSMDYECRDWNRYAIHPQYFKSQVLTIYPAVVCASLAVHVVFK